MGEGGAGERSSSSSHTHTHSQLPYPPLPLFPSLIPPMKESPSKLAGWRPLTAKYCCSAEDHAIFGSCRNASSKTIGPLPSFRRLSLSDLSHSSSARIAEDLAHSFGPDLYDFQLTELRAITQNFSSHFLLGEGGFGTVHKGYVDDNLRPGLKSQAVAVKLLDIQGLQGHREWLVRTWHTAYTSILVKLIGYCCEDEDRLLVYEFMSRGSLENHLTSTRRLRCIVDPRLAGQYSVKGAKELALLALQCVSLNPKDRPKMPAIVEALEVLQNLKDMAVSCGQWSAAATAKGRRIETGSVIYWKHPVYAENSHESQTLMPPLRSPNNTLNLFINHKCQNYML